jgi:hypothetical protein
MNPIGYKLSLAGRFWAVTAILIFYALPAQAQFVPGPYYNPDMSVLGTIDSSYQSRTQQQAYTANREMQMQSTMAKSMAWQNINRSMQAEAASQPTTVPDSGQSARDWMFQHQAPSRPARRPMTLPASNVAVVAPVEKFSQSAAPKEIMLWPTLLKEQRFDGDRADVEAPFRRAYSDGQPLTIGDYQGIIKTVEGMKTTVEGMKSQLIEEEYTAVQKYLDDLIADAQKRIQAREGAEKGG